MKILLAEDDFATRKFMAGFLSKYGDVTAPGTAWPRGTRFCWRGRTATRRIW